MVKRGKSVAKTDYEDEEGEQLGSVIFLGSSDDEEANEDLSLEIVEKARRREPKRQKGIGFGEAEKKSFGSGAVINLSSSSSDEIESVDARVGEGAAEEVLEEAVKKSKKKSKKSKKKKNTEIYFEKAEEPSETATTVEIEAVVMLANVVRAEYLATDEAAHSGAVGTSNDVIRVDEQHKTVQTMDKEANGISDNAVLRKLLRGPRYFDPPDSRWGTCYNCGKEGHSVVNCTEEKRKKPCFVCGKFGHGAKHCTQGQNCFICKRRGHLAKDCPEKHQDSCQSYKICLRCGDSGHNMSSCRNDFAPDDMKAIQCYVCKNFGHLCCANIIDAGPREVSCYNCGQLGHTGVGCAKPRGETSAASAPGSCYNCGEEGHFARGCTKFAKATQVRGQPWTPNQRISSEARHMLGFRSEPHNLGKSGKKKTITFDGRKNMTTGKSKWRGGWVADDPEDLRGRQTKSNGWSSPRTPTKNGHKISAFAAGGHSSSSRSSFKHQHKILPGTPGSPMSRKRFQHNRLGRAYD